MICFKKKNTIFELQQKSIKSIRKSAIRFKK